MTGIKAGEPVVPQSEADELRPQDSVKARQVPPRWRHQCHQSFHQHRRLQREGLAPLRRVFDAAIIEFSQAAFGDGPATSVAAQTLQSLAVIRVYCRVCGSEKPFATATRFCFFRCKGASNAKAS